MSFVGSNILAGASGQGDADYKIERSLRFNSGDSAYLNRTPSSAGNRKTFTLSAWVKATAVANTQQIILSASSGSTPYTSIDFRDNNLRIIEWDGSNITFEVKTNAVLRDVSAWYHIVFAVDTTQSTAADRVKIYVNGVQLTSFATASYPSQNHNTHINNNTLHKIGDNAATSYTGHLSSYLADVHLIDGQALAPTEFGEFDNNNIWQPKKYSGTYGPTPVNYADNSQTDLPDGNVYLSTQPVENIFDGNDTTYARINRGSNSQTVATFKWEPTGGYAGVTKLRIKYNYSQQYRINGGDWNNVNNNGGYQEIYNGSAFTLNTLEIRRSDASGSDYGIFVHAIEINDSLVSNVGNNGFHLDFSDNSTNAALGTDSSGTNNTWTVNNISAIDSVGSIYAEFSGSSNQYLRNNSGNVLPGSNGAFTIECHFYPHTTNVIGLFDGGSGSTSIMRNYGNNTIEKQSGGSVSFAGDYTQNAWNHIAIVYTGSTGTDRLTVYVNGTESGYASGLNGFTPGSTFDIGTINGGGDGRFDGYIRNFRVTHAVVYSSNFTAPSHSNNLSALTDTKLLVVTTPANGLTGAGSGTTLGMSNNGSVSSGTLTPASETDSVIDTPTDYEAGSGNNAGNYATLNPLDKHSDFTTSNGNLDVVTSGTSWRSIRATIGISSGKYYWEFTTGHNRATVGISTSQQAVLDDYVGNNSSGWSYLYDGNKYHAGSITSYGNSYAAGDTIGVAFDADAGNIYFYKNGTVQNSGTAAYTGLTSGPYFPTFSFRDSGNTFTANFGQRPFKHTPPTGFKSLSTQNLADPTITDSSTVFDAKIWTGDGNSTRSINSYSFSPDFVWIKNRTTSGWQHVLYDQLRGAGTSSVTKSLSSDSTRTEASGNDTNHGYLSGFTSNGFDLTKGSQSGGDYVNHNNWAYVGWAWDGGDLVTNSAYNQSQTWSSAITSSTGFRSNEPATNGFDGSTSTICSAVGSGLITFAPTGTFPSNSAIRIYLQGSGSQTVTVNGGAGQTISGNSWQTVNFTNSSASSFTLTIQASGGTDSGLRALEIGGKLLVDAGVIPVGSLNSSFYDTSQTWSNSLSSPQGAYGSSSVTNAFNGSLNDGFESGNPSGGYSTMRFEPSSGITVSSVRIYASDYSDGSVTFQWRVNDGSWNNISYTSGNTYKRWIDFNFSGTLNSFEYRSNTSSTYKPELRAVELSGALLIDSGTSLSGLTQYPTIASTVRANPSAGFSIATYSGVDSPSSNTVGHGLNAAPVAWLIKNRTGTGNWTLTFNFLDGSNDYLFLNLRNAKADQGSPWNTAPTSSVITLGANDLNTCNAGDNYVMYAFAPVEGYSAFGSYTGNGSTNGPFIYTGFKPKWIMFKNASDSSDEWMMYDSERNLYNPIDNSLEADTSDAENTGAYDVDSLSNGFKVRTTTARINTSSKTYIYMAFAEHPFKYSRAR